MTKTELAEETTRPGRTFRPAVDVAETDQGLWLWADMPGVDEKDVEVELNDNVLSIQATVSAEDYSELTPVYTEYNVGNFAHRFRLSNEIDGANIKARMTHGVLELQLPKVAAAQPRKIEIGA